MKLEPFMSCNEVWMIKLCFDWKEPEAGIRIMRFLISWWMLINLWWCCLLLCLRLNINIPLCIDRCFNKKKSHMKFVDCFLRNSAAVIQHTFIPKNSSLLQRLQVWVLMLCHKIISRHSQLIQWNPYWFQPRVKVPSWKSCGQLRMIY